MFFSKLEEKIMTKFDDTMENYGCNQIYKMTMPDGSIIIVRFDTCYDSENCKEEDDPEYEEFKGYAFEIKEVLYLNEKYKDIYKKGKYFEICYHNCPIEYIPLGQLRSYPDGTIVEIEIID